MCAAAARFWDLGVSSLWLDEVSTLDDSATLSRALFKGYHPPLSYVLVWLARSVLGDGDAALRTPSALAGVAVVGLAMLWLRQTRLVAAPFYLACGAVLVVLPSAVGHAREARMYAMWTAMTLLLLMTTWAFLRTRSRAGAWLLGLVAALNMATHAYAALYVVTASAVVLWFVGPRRAWPAVALPGAVLVPLLVRLAHLGDKVKEPVGAVIKHIEDGAPASPLAIATASVWFQPRLEVSAGLQVVLGLVVIAVLLGALGRIVLDAGSAAAPLERAHRALVVGFALVPPLFLFVFPVKSAVRMFAPATVLGVAIVFLAVALLRSRPTRAIAAAAIALATATTLPFLERTYRREVEPWRSVCELVATDPGVVLVTARYVAKAYRRCDGGNEIVPFPKGPLDVDGAVAAVRDRPVVWLIRSHTYRSATADVDDRASELLPATHTLAARRHFGSVIRVDRWVRRGP